MPEICYEIDTLFMMILYFKSALSRISHEIVTPAYKDMCSIDIFRVITSGNSYEICLFYRKKLMSNLYRMNELTDSFSFFDFSFVCPRILGPLFLASLGLEGIGFTYVS